MGGKKRWQPSVLVVEIAKIPVEGLPLDAEIPATALHLPPLPDVTVRTPIRIRGLLSRVTDQVYFDGRIEGVLQVPCSRCLEEVTTGFCVETRAVYLPPGSELASEVEAEGEELDLYQHSGNTVDLHELVYDQVVLAVPVQPLCRDTCAGLCQVCGGNRNITPCTCQEAEGDPRLAVLKRLRVPESS
ncbi:MAG: hypothetical protein KatS3mg131_0616 [Candidatus Tectimicrobiota bacterium]|nr:MAG: hypothetical protein KatS3mg131_0616 [Candidatus Tectomicrobia bacterium]